MEKGLGCASENRGGGTFVGVLSMSIRIFLALTVRHVCKSKYSFRARKLDFAGMELGYRKPSLR